MLKVNTTSVSVGPVYEKLTSISRLNNFTSKGLLICKAFV